MVVRTTGALRDDAGREDGRATGVASGNDDGGGIDAGGGEGCRGGGIDRGEDVRFVGCAFGIDGDREATGLAGALSFGCVENDFRGWRESGGDLLVGDWRGLETRADVEDPGVATGFVGLVERGDPDALEEGDARYELARRRPELDVR